MTLIASLKCEDALVMSADTEMVISEAPTLRSRTEKIHVLSDGTADWRILVAGAGMADYIGMARDFIKEKTTASPATDRDILKAIRDSIHEIWRDYARYEPGGVVQLDLLIGTWSNDHQMRSIVVRGPAIREGGNLEAMGIGDATFRAVADRFLNHDMLSRIIGTTEMVRFFTVYAMQQAKQTIPGVGGSTRIVTLTNSGQIQYEKSFKIVAIQDFYRNFDTVLRTHLSNQGRFDPRTAEELVSTMYKFTLKAVKKLRKNLKEIEETPMLA